MWKSEIIEQTKKTQFVWGNKRSNKNNKQQTKEKPAATKLNNLFSRFLF